MMKSLTALAMLALLGVLVVAVPGFAPQVKASETVALTKADRLPTKFLAPDCSNQVWPNIAVSCLRGSETAIRVQEARLVTARR